MTETKNEQYQFGILRFTEAEWLNRATDPEIVAKVTSADKIIVGDEVLKDRYRTTPYNLREDAEQAVRTLLEYIGEDPTRGGLVETPRRYVKALLEYTAGLRDVDDATLLKTFEDGADGYDEIVLQRDIPFSSMCEHHMAPFIGVAHVGYIPGGEVRRIVGLSKLVRLVGKYSRRLQVQERITAQVAEALWTALNPVGVGVILEARHTCIECRGVSKAGSTTVTSKMMGVFKDKPEARAEFLALVQRGK